MSYERAASTRAGRLAPAASDVHTARRRPIVWGRIGDYEAVTRSGILFLLSPEPAHPSRRVTSA